MTSRTILVTGATDGIGRQTARELARAGHRLILHGRSADKLAATAREVGAVATGGAPETIRADFASLAQVRSMAAELHERFDVVDTLLNNAGVYMNQRRETRDGFEATFGINHLAPFLLTHLLLDLVRASREGRVVNVSSVAHGRGRIDLDDLQSVRGFDPYRAYAASKLANVLFTVELAERLGPDATVTVNALHPGVVSTKLLTEGFGISGSDSLAEGAETSIYLATSAAVRGETGGYYARSRPARASRAVDDADLRRRLYERSAALVGIDGLPAAE